MKRHALVVLCVTLVSCAPPYIAVLNSSSALTRQMTTVGTFGPVYMQTNSDNIRFLPLKPTATTLDGVSIQSGFTVTEDAGYEYLGFAYVGSDGQGQLTRAQVSPFPPRCEFDVLSTTTTTGSIMVLDYLKAAALLYPVTLPYGGFGTPGSTDLSTLFPSSPVNYSVLGGQLMPGVSPDTYGFLLFDGSSFAEGTVGVSGGASAFATTTTSTPVPALPVGQRALYGQATLTGPGYASFFDGSRWVCYQVSSTTATQLTGVTHRLDAVLSTGELLSTEGGVFRLYDPNGSLLVSVSLGGLQLCYEASISGTAYAFFSLPISLRDGNWMFRTYAIPTTSLRSLGG